MSTRPQPLKGLVSVVIPVEPGGSVASALGALKSLPKAEKSLILEVLVAQGRNPSRQRNLAVARARGAFIHFLDSDSRLQPGSLPRLLAAAKPAKVAVAGGPNLAPGDESLNGRAFDRVLGSWLGSFRSAARYRALGVRRPCTEKELILCNLLFRREAYFRLGGLREDLYPNEENELFNRAAAQGWTLAYEPAGVVWRSRRQTLAAFSYQAFRYGRGRLQQMRTGFHASDIINLAPLGLLLCLLAALSLLAGPASAWVGRLQAAGLALFGLFCTAAFLSANLGPQPLLPSQRLKAFLAYPCRHLAYAVGLVAGLFQKPQARPWAVKVGKQRW